MPRSLNRLSARGVSTIKMSGMHADGAGLYLRVRGETARSWIFVWHEAGKRREMGLGAPPAVGLARARERAQAAREAIADGRDPVAERRSVRRIPTFGVLADEYIKDRTSSVRSDKSVARWERCIGANGYAESLRALRIDRVTTEDVLAVLRPIWSTKSPTAALLRGYIEAVLNLAKASGYRRGENPAAWAGHLALILPKPQKLQRGHHAAMPFSQLPDFMVKLRSRDALAARALELTILCATRTAETLEATWSEFDLDQALWTIPASRTKMTKEHRIPLSDKVVEVLRDIGPAGGFVFKGRASNRPLSGMSMEMLLRRMEVEFTVHGFRSTFRDWAGEKTDTPREVAEAALAHTVGNSAELAYRRGDALEKRRKLMKAWAEFCGSPS